MGREREGPLIHLPYLKAKVTKRKQSLANIAELGKEFILAVNSLALGDEFESTVSSLDETVLDLAIVALFGLKGTEALRFAHHHIPDAYCNRKIMYTKKILQTVCNVEEEDLYRSMSSILQV